MKATKKIQYLAKKAQGQYYIVKKAQSPLEESVEVARCRLMLHSIQHATPEQFIQAELIAFRETLDRAKQDKKLPLPVQQALGCIHQHLFDKRLNVSFVRQQCGLRNNNISSRFRHTLGQGMRCYIEKQRLRAAKRLLRHDGLGILQIAWAVGYVHPETFERAFKRCEGYTPSRFRKRNH